MCDGCNKCSENGICPECFLQVRSSLELSKDMVNILLLRLESCNAILFAAANALENNSEYPEAIISATTELVVELAEVDQNVLDLLDYIDEEEKNSYCDDCICIGCPYALDCGGVCFFDDEDFFGGKINIEVSV
ncbi:MAG: hypothetical protein PHD15_04805 [Clostridia bacterium]|nr:hypothetical protein [Clostridia bacterium]MDD4387059.1 hypothetical protein [Clostridia bacterium]